MNEEQPADDLTATIASAFEAMDIPAVPAPNDLLARMDAELKERSLQADRPASVRAVFSRRRLMIGGLGAAALAAVSAALFWPWTHRLSAMERMARSLREVTSYQYQLSSITIESVKQGQQMTTWNEHGEVFWQAPNAFRFRDRIVKRITPHVGRGEQLLEDFVEVYPANTPGLLIDHKRKTYVRLGFAPAGSAMYPWQPLQMIREGQGQVIRELGVRRLDGVTRRGYVTRFKSGDPARDHDWQVWVDAASDLPLEISYTVDDGQEPRTTTVLRATQFRWNEAIKPTWFNATPPKNYSEKQVRVENEDEK